MCAAAALSTGVGLTSVHSSERVMHAVHPSEMFLVIITNILLGRTSHSRI